MKLFPSKGIKNLWICAFCSNPCQNFMHSEFNKMSFIEFRSVCGLFCIVFVSNQKIQLSKKYRFTVS